MRVSLSPARLATSALILGRLPAKAVPTSSSKVFSTSAPHYNQNSDGTSGDSDSSDNNVESSPAGTRGTASSSSSSTYTPPSQAHGSWPFASSSSASSTGPASSSASSSAQKEDDDFPSNPYKGIFDGPDPYPTVDSPIDGSSSNWLSERLDTLSRPSSSSSSRARANISAAPRVDASGRKKNLVPRSVLFADDKLDHYNLEQLRPRRRKSYNTTPLTGSEANAFKSLLNFALSHTSPSSSSSSSSTIGQRSAFDDDDGTMDRGSTYQDDQEIQFGSFTKMGNDPRNQLEGFAVRNRLRQQRFEHNRIQRAKRFADREGIASSVSQAELEAGIDEAREQIAACENLAQVWMFAGKHVWGVHSMVNQELSTGYEDVLASLSLKSSREQNTDGETNPSNAEANELDSPDPEMASNTKSPKFGMMTPFYPSVLHMLFKTIWERYRNPHVALAIPRVTRALGIESWVLGMTGALYTDILQVQWFWLGDIHGVVSTLQSAREIGILSSPTNVPGGSITTAESGDAKSGYSITDRTARMNDRSMTAGRGGARNWTLSNDDQTIRETVDRITNQIRTFVIDQLITAHPEYKKDFLYSAQPSIFDALSEGSNNATDEGNGGVLSISQDKNLNWYQKQLLDLAAKASQLAGKPFRLMDSFSHANRSRPPGSGYGYQRPPPYRGSAGAPFGSQGSGGAHSPRVNRSHGFQHRPQSPHPQEPDQFRF